MTVYCFYEPSGLHQDREMETLLLWQRKWQELGYATKILNEKYASKHDLYSQLVDAAAKAHTALDRTFQRFCFVRWCAMSKAGGGVFTDYDVLPHTWFKMPQDADGGLCGDATLCPGFVIVNKIWCDYFINICIEGKVQVNDFNDMEVIRAMEKPFANVMDIVRTFGERGWRHAPLVHFNNNSLYANRATCIEYLLK